MNTFEAQEKKFLASGQTLGEVFLSSPIFGSDKGLEDDQDSDSWIIGADKADLDDRYVRVRKKALSDASTHALQFLIDAKRDEKDWEKQITNIFNDKAIEQAAHDLEKGFGLPFTNRALLEDQSEQHFSSSTDKVDINEFQFNY